MDIARIEEILADSFGELDEDRLPLPGCEVVDLFMMSIVYNTEKVQEHAAEMVELLKDWPSESWGQPVAPLGKEISYIAAGGALEDQRRAFMLFGFGKVLDWWDILSPQTVLGLEKDDEMAQYMASLGFVSITGYRPNLT